MTPLTWLELTRVDDFLTMNLIDNTEYSPKTRKVSRLSKKCEIHKNVIFSCIKRFIIAREEPDYSSCVARLMRLPQTQYFIKEYLEGKDSVDNFIKHMMKYLKIFAPDCPFDLVHTDRYKLKTNRIETAAVAREKIDANVAILSLEGTFAEIDAEVEELLGQNDFSIFQISSTNKRKRNAFKLMLGPSRFVNHNCEANAKFSQHNQTGMRIVSIRTINPGEEITVSYAPSYFGNNNKNCLCAACERNSKGWFDPNKFVIPPDAHIQEIESSSDEHDSIIEQVTVKPTESRRRTRSEGLEETNSFEIQDDADKNPYGDIKVAVDSSIKTFDKEKETAEVEGSHDSDETIVTQRPSPSLNNLQSASEKFCPTKPEVVGGRTLRARVRKRNYYKPERYLSPFLHSLPEDTSIDSLEAIPSMKPSGATLNRRKVQRQLHKLYMTELYKPDADLKMVFDCGNCGVYFKLSEFYEIRGYCPRCYRHQRLYDWNWPHTRETQYSIKLELEVDILRSSISDLQIYRKCKSENHRTDDDTTKRRCKNQLAMTSTNRRSEAEIEPTSRDRKLAPPKPRIKLKEPKEGHDISMATTDTEVPEVIFIGESDSDSQQLFQFFNAHKKLKLAELEDSVSFSTTSGMDKMTDTNNQPKEVHFSQ